jgi:site-specific recombinase XerC
VAFAIETGLRRSEQFGLRWEHISFESQTLTIPMSKSGKTRHVPLSSEALRIIRTMDTLDSPYVFAGIRKPLQPMDSRAFLRRAYEPAMLKAKIRNASWHTLRHTTASRLVMAGVPLVTVKDILGHRDIQTTMKYAHLSPDHIKAAIEKGSLAHLEMKTEAGTVTKTVTSEKAGSAKTSQVVDSIGAPDWNRTSNLLIRSQVLYPIELRAHALFINELGESVKVAE